MYVYPRPLCSVDASMGPSRLTWWSPKKWLSQQPKGCEPASPAFRSCRKVRRLFATADAETREQAACPPARLSEIKIMVIDCMHRVSSCRTMQLNVHVDLKITDTQPPGILLAKSHKLLCELPWLLCLSARHFPPFHFHTDSSIERLSPAFLPS